MKLWRSMLLFVGMALMAGFLYGSWTLGAATLAFVGFLFTFSLYSYGKNRCSDEWPWFVGVSITVQVVSWSVLITGLTKHLIPGVGAELQVWIGIVFLVVAFAILLMGWLMTSSGKVFLEFRFKDE